MISRNGHSTLSPHPNCQACELVMVLRNVEGFHEERYAGPDDATWIDAVEGAAIRAYLMAVDRYAVSAGMRDAIHAAAKEIEA